jgi:methyl-accepting chemotaxis protein
MISTFDAWSLRQVRIEDLQNVLANNADNVTMLVRQYADFEQHGVLSRDVEKEAMERIRSNEQSIGIEQVGLAISQMDSVTQQNAALAGQEAAAAHTLSEQANGLTQTVATFRLQGDYRHPRTSADLPIATELANVQFA